MECKVFSFHFSLELAAVLIETLWNVKNAKFVVYNDGALGINRNIVECKVFQVLLLRLSWRSINRKIVECKARKYQSCNCLIFLY